MEFLTWLFASGDFTPHGYCYRWVQGLVWLHVVSDTLIFLAYMTIPFTLGYVVLRRKDLPFNWMFLCFGIFIVSCGLTHAMEVWNLWHAAYWLAGTLKAVTATASVGTAILLIQLVPQTLSLPSVSALHDANEALASQAKEVRASEARFRGILESAPDAMVIADAQGRIVLVNAETERLFGYRRDELVGQPVEILMPEQFREKHPQHRREYTAQPRRRSMDGLRGLRKDGTAVPLEIMLSPLESAEGILITATIRDITERKKSEELVKTVGELKRSNEELQQFAYFASHDLQEPLRMVSSYTQLLAKRYKGRLDADADEFIGYAVDGCNRMQRLIRDLLSFSRAGASGKAFQDISTENALNEGLKNLRTVIEESGAIVSHDLLPAITTDGTQLAQIFQNLVGNAIKYRSAAVPHVNVSATKNGGKEWIFSVRDNGMGIDPQYFERIFVLFQRLHGQKEFQGTGIGLAICKKIVEGLGGRIWVESQLGKGSTFYFALPERG